MLAPLSPNYPYLGLMGPASYALDVLDALPPPQPFNTLYGYALPGEYLVLQSLRFLHLVLQNISNSPFELKLS